MSFFFSYSQISSGIPGSESCYLKQGIPFEIRDWEDDDVPATRVMLQYLTDQVSEVSIKNLLKKVTCLIAPSSQMYNLIRGKGLTYGISMSGSVTEGRLRVKFSRSSQLETAYKVFRDIIANYR